MAGHILKYFKPMNAVQAAARPPLPVVSSTKRKTDEEKVETARLYETKRNRTFKQVWITEHPWLIYDGNHMYCKPCRSCYSVLSISKLPDKGQFQKYSKGPFVKGTNNFRHSTIQDHSSSEGHKLASINVENRSKPGKSQADLCVKQLNKSIFNKLDHLFRNAHAIAKSNRPFTDLSWMASLDEKKGLSVGKSYRNGKSCRQFINSISCVELASLKKELESAKFLTLLSDGSTDVSVKENEVVYLRFSVAGVPKVYFLNMQDVEKADANGIFDALKKSLKMLGALEEVSKKIVGFAADGASVNTGHMNGVISKMQAEWSECIVIVICLVHRLELTFKEALKSDALFDKVLQLLSNMYAFYHKSPLQRTGLKRSFEALNMDPVYPTRTGGTRWLSHTLTALTKLERCYKPCLQHLGQVIEHSDSKMANKGRGLLKMLKSKPIMCYAHFLQDILTCLSKLSLELQKEDASIHNSHEQLEATQLSLSKLKDSPGFHLRKVHDKEEFHGEKLVGDFNLSTTSNTIVRLLECFERRFQYVQTDVLGATRIVNLSSWPIEFKDDFGDEYVKTLTDHFAEILTSNHVDPAQIANEWDLLKSLLYKNEDVQKISWDKINTSYKQRCPNILHLVDLVLSLPASSSQCERGFSLMKHIKTDYRNKMKASSLTDLMRTNLHSPPIEQFDPSEAIYHWNSCGFRSRRPTYGSSSDKLQLLTNEQLEAEAGAAASTSAASSMAIKPLPESDSDSDVDSLFSEISDSFSLSAAESEIDDMF